MLIGTGIGLAALMGGYAGDAVGDAGDGLGVTTASRDLPRELLYMLNIFQLNSGDVRYSPSVDRDRCLACDAHGWGWR